MYCTAALISNNAAKLGAGIFNDVGSRLTLDAVNITSNTAETHGGGIFNKGNMNFKGGIVWRNYHDNIWDGIANANVGLRPDGNLSALNPIYRDGVCVYACGVNTGSCTVDKCSSSCTDCKDTYAAWAAKPQQRMKTQHACRQDGKAACDGTDEHGCTTCRCKP